MSSGVPFSLTRLLRLRFSSPPEAVDASLVEACSRPAKALAARPSRLVRDLTASMAIYAYPSEVSPFQDKYSETRDLRRVLADVRASLADSPAGPAAGSPLSRSEAPSPSLFFPHDQRLLESPSMSEMAAPAGAGPFLRAAESRARNWVLAVISAADALLGGDFGTVCVSSPTISVLFLGAGVGGCASPRVVTSPASLFAAFAATLPAAAHQTFSPLPSASFRHAPALLITGEEHVAAAARFLALEAHVIPSHAARSKAAAAPAPDAFFAERSVALPESKQAVRGPSTPAPPTSYIDFPCITAKGPFDQAARIRPAASPLVSARPSRRSPKGARLHECYLCAPACSPYAAFPPDAVIAMLLAFAAASLKFYVRLTPWEPSTGFHDALAAGLRTGREHSLPAGHSPSSLARCPSPGLPKHCTACRVASAAGAPPAVLVMSRFSTWVANANGGEALRRRIAPGLLPRSPGELWRPKT
jgi:hypothetical protein